MTAQLGLWKGEMGYGASAKSTRFEGQSLGVIEKINETTVL
jgi:hypothetical protein